MYVVFVNYYVLVENKFMVYLIKNVVAISTVMISNLDHLNFSYIFWSSIVKK